ncbi:DUF1446-domain-containing protein [Rhizodiscina lignyota]|uniref:DUF1446-domain-containing protein n=1 Tax=Rhizodiscina lignyota TaxID=1504668 RepID=A0A9P4IKZ5_9PEZI|nr:DUF1446-domain-containing protein [Rhizodiscina lignyota]
MSSIQQNGHHDERGTRPVRIANCSGGQMEPGWQMRKQASLGNVDFITGDWLAENNIAQEAAAMEAGTGEGFKKNAWEALQLSMEVINQKRIKVVINGGGLSPQNLAKRCQELIDKNNYNLTVAFVSGDNMVGQDTNFKPEDVLACTAYIGARGIVKGLEAGADLILCGRVADASPVIGACMWWWGWSDTDYNRLAGAFLTGHLLECSGYITGSNYSGFHRFPLERFVDVGFPIGEIERDGSCIITKHEGTNGMVTEDTVKCQFLYEIQGNVYLNSDVTALLDNVQVRQVSKDRVHFSGMAGRPPPPTTKLAIFYKGGWESQNLSNAAGYATRKKYLLYEMQVRARLAEQGLNEAFDCLEFQVVGTPKENPTYQLESTTYFRIYAQAATPEPLAALKLLLADETMQHFSGLHWSQDLRTADPKSFYVYYPALVSQDEIKEAVHLLGPGGKTVKSIECTRPPAYEKMGERESYDPGSNINCGLFVHRPEIWEWFRSFMTLDRMKSLIGGDWKDEYRLERVEFPNIYAVHFVIYGILGRGVSSSTLLDNRGKGFTDYVRVKHVDVPEKFLQWSWKEDE